MEKTLTHSARANSKPLTGRKAVRIALLLIITGTALLLSLPSRGTLPNAGLVPCLVIITCCLIKKNFQKMSKFKLIDGTFTVAEANEVILALLEYKINFHSKESFRSEIQKGHKDARSLERKQELLKTKEDFRKKLSEMDPDATIKITADIILS